jgi:predicted DNA-binding transcriptional regulator AlpA
MCGGFSERLVTDAEVARRLGTTREQVWELMTRSDFPEPLGHIDSRSADPRSVPFWRWSDVDAWACEGGHTTSRHR